MPDFRFRAIVQTPPRSQSPIAMGFHVLCIAPGNRLARGTALGKADFRREPPDTDSDVVRCALLPDYYVRTGAETLKDVPQIKAEMTRIWADFDFVCSGPTWEQVPERMEGYKKLDPLA